MVQHKEVLKILGDKMTFFTAKKRLYVEARLSGKNFTEAAIAAGCPVKYARQSGSRLEKDPDVVAAFRRYKEAGQNTSNQLRNNEPEASKVAVLNTDLDDPLDFMRRMMNDPKQDARLRLEAAKALAAHTIIKAGAKGKKQEQAEAAKEVANRLRILPVPKPFAVK